MEKDEKDIIIRLIIFNAIPIFVSLLVSRVSRAWAHFRKKKWGIVFFTHDSAAE